MRARAYLVIVAALRFALGGVIIIRQGYYDAPYFRGERSHEIWGGILILVGLVALYSAIAGSVHAARWALFFAIVTSGFWLGQALADGWFYGAVFLLGLAAKDGTMLRNPLRDPFDRLVAKKLSPTAGK